MASYERRGKYWSVRFRYIDERGLEVNKRLSKDESENNFATKKEAEQAYIQFVSTIKQNKKLATQKITKFIDLFNEYIEYRKTRVKESTYFNVLYIYKEHILPYFSNYKLSDITTQVINKWQQGLEKYSYKYKTKIRNYCKLVLDYGEKYYHIPNNFKFCDNFTKSNESSKEMHIWTPAQFEVFDNQITDLQDKTMFNFLYLMGTRKGEMGALHWSDVDFGNKTCTISKSLTRGEGGLKLGATTKNQKRRVVVIPTKLLKLLVELKKHQSRDEVFSEEWFVFGSKNNHLTYNPLAAKYNKYYNLAKNYQSDLQRIRIHDFRHSHVSLLINQTQSKLGITTLLYAIAERIGDTVEQVLKTYGHLFPDKQQDLIATLNTI